MRTEEQEKIQDQTGKIRRMRPSFSVAFTSLQHRNYRLWFTGQMASLVGTWMQTTAIGFLVFQLTHSAAYLGYVGFAAGIPTLFLTLLGGVASDRMPRRTLLLITQYSMMALAGVLSFLTFFGAVQPWHLLVIAFCNGIANAFDGPARQSFVRELVPPEDMTNAIALNATMFNSALAVGPAVAGITYAAFGPGICFAVNAVSFLAVIVALSRMHLQPFVKIQRTASALRDLKEGLRYVVSQDIIRVLIIVVAILNIFGMGYMTLFPAWAVNILHGNSVTLGLLQSSRGVGSLIGALGIASLGRFRYKGKLLTVGSFVFPIFLLFFAFARLLPVSLAMLIGAGWGFMALLNMCNALVQTHVADELRGRVMSVYTLSMMGMMPIGALFCGTLAEATNLTLTVALCGVLMLLFSAWVYFRRPQIRALE
jgi:MFS family permease